MDLVIVLYQPGVDEDLSNNLVIVLEIINVRGRISHNRGNLIVDKKKVRKKQGLLINLNNKIVQSGLFMLE